MLLFCNVVFVVLRFVLRVMSCLFCCVWFGCVCCSVCVVGLCLLFLVYLWCVDVVWCLLLRVLCWVWFVVCDG